MKKKSQHGKIIEVLETACIESRYKLMLLLYRVKCGCPIQFNAFFADDYFACAKANDQKSWA